MFVLVDRLCPQCRNAAKCRHEKQSFYVRYFYTRGKKRGTMLTKVLDDAKIFRTSKGALAYRNKWIGLGLPAGDRIQVLKIGKE